MNIIHMLYYCIYDNYCLVKFSYMMILEPSTNSSQSDTLQVKPPHSCKIFQIMVYIGPKTLLGNQVRHILIILPIQLLSSLLLQIISKHFLTPYKPLRLTQKNFLGTPLTLLNNAQPLTNPETYIYQKWEGFTRI